MKSKRILSIILMLALFANFLIMANFPIMANAKVTNKFDFDDKVSILQKIGTLSSEYDNLTLDKEQKMSKAEFAYMAANILNIKKSDKLYFHDLSKDDWALEYVSGLVESNILNVPEDRIFNPDDIITAYEAGAMMVRALGYIDAMRNGTEDYTMVNEIANDIGLYKEIKNVNALTFEDTVEILFNTLLSNVMEIKSAVNGRVKYEKSDKTYLEKVFNIIAEEGKLEAVNSISINGQNILDGHCVISGEEYLLADETFADYLGMNIIFLYKNEDVNTDKEVIWGKPSKDNDSLSLNYYENDISFDENNYVMTYLTENGKYKNVRISKGINLIYNGRFVKNGADEVLSGEFNTINLIKEKNSNSYSTAVIWGYEDFLVGSVDSVNEIIYDKITGSHISIKDAEKLLIVNSDGTESSFESIGANDLLSIYSSLDNDYIRIVISKECINGLVTGIREENGYTYITVDGNEYRSNKKKDIPYAKINEEVDVYLNALGLVAYVRKNTNSNYIGYLIKQYYDEDEEKLLIKFYDESGKILKLECAERVKVGGIKCKKAETAYELLGGNAAKTEMMVYTKNKDDKITSIYVADSDKKSPLHIRYAKADYTYRSSGKMGNKMVLNNDTIIFEIPNNVYDANEDAFSIRRKSDLRGDNEYEVTSYATKENIGYEEILVIKNGNWRDSADYNSGMLVIGVNEALNEDGDVVECIVGYEGGQKVVRQCKEGYSVKETEDIDSGDYIFYVVDNKKKIKKVIKKYDLSANRILCDLNMYIENALTAGYIHNITDNVAEIGHNSADSIDEVVDLNLGVILVYDTKYNSVTVGRIEDLVSYNISQSNASYIISHQKYMVPFSCVVYK